MNQKENELIELAHQLKVLETEVEKFRTDKKKIDAEIKRTTKTIEEAKDKIISYMFQNKKTELDLKVYKFFVRNTTAVDTEEFMKLLKTLTNNTHVIVISHKADQLTEKFERTISFEKKNNFSKMVIQ